MLNYYEAHSYEGKCARFILMCLTETCKVGTPILGGDGCLLDLEHNVRST